MIRVGILSVSDGAARGLHPDATHLAMRKALAKGPFEVAAYELVAQESAQIKRVLRLWADREGYELILSAGGTGLSPRDNTPEATRELLEREVPGLAEQMRSSIGASPLVTLSRGLVGTRGQSLIVNLPGEPEDARTALEAILSLLPKTIEMITGKALTPQR